MENAANRIALTGALDTLPEYSHTNHDRKFYRLMLAVERLSGAVDLLPVLAAEDVLEQADLFCGERIAVTGQLRSFNNRAPEGRRLIISVYAETFTTTDAPAQNEVCLEGAVCKPPVYRRTPRIFWKKQQLFSETLQPPRHFLVWIDDQPICAIPCTKERSQDYEKEYPLACCFACLDDACTYLHGMRVQQQNGSL